MDAMLRRVRTGSLIPLDQQLFSFIGAEQRKLSQWLVGIGENARQQRLEVPGQALDRLLLEQVGLVLPDTCQPILPLFHNKSQVVLCHSAFNTDKIQSNTL